MRRLTAATLTLLGAAAPPAAASVEFDTGLLLYAEGDGRVLAIEPVISVAHDFGGERRLNVKLVYDSLTGATPNGAAPASTPQTFTQPSGRGTFTAQPGETPLDGTFRDTRVALSGDYSQPAGERGTLGGGLNASTEYDFFSAGGNVRYAHDFNQNNTTLSAAFSYESDAIEPVGGAPAPLAPMAAPGALGPRDATKSKSVTDVIVGLAQVLDPRSLVQLNYSLSASSGYHTDPYKLLSVVDANGEPLRYVYESRPDSRDKHALFARYKRFVFARDVVDVSYRYMADDWSVRSSTVDLLYRWNYSETSHLEPHLRWYTQSAAEFYRAALYDGEEATLAYASGDPRLGAFDGYTLGLKYGRTLDSGASWSARLEYYRQAGRRAGIPDPAAAGLSKFDLEPDLEAVMFTAGYRFSW